MVTDAVSSLKAMVMMRCLHPPQRDDSLEGSVGESTGKKGPLEQIVILQKRFNDAGETAREWGVRMVMTGCSAVVEPHH